MSTKLHSLDEHSLDDSSLLAIARSLREKIDWEQLRARTVQTPYAKPFFTLVAELGIAPERSREVASAHVRVVSGDFG